MSNNHDDVTPDSTYAPLQPPTEFKSEIPTYLLKDASPQDQHIMEALSIGAQYNRWLVNALVETHSQVRRTNGRLIKAEEDIKHLKGEEKSVKVGWKVIGWIAGAIVTLVTVAASIYEALHAS